MDINKISYESGEAIEVYNHEKDKWGELYVYENYFKKPGKILDLGCGTGRTSSTLAARGHEVFAIDYSEKMINEAKKKYNNLDFRVMDAKNLAFADAFFDYAFFSFNGIDYLQTDEDREKVFKEVFRVLKSGGIFAFSSHNAFFIPNSFSRLYVQLRSFVHGKIYPYRLEFHTFGRLLTHYISPKSEIREISRNGFGFVEIASKYGKSLRKITFQDPYPMYICKKI